MSRKPVVIALAIALAAGAGLWLWTHSSAPATSPAAKDAKAKVASTRPAPSHAADSKAQAAPPMPRFSLDDEPEGTLRLEGLVQDGDGQPVAGAIVSIDSIPPRFVSTGEDGTFFFDKLIGRNYSVGAHQGARTAGPVNHLLTTTSDPVVLTLHQGAAVVVEVRDPSGHPVASASVELRAQVPSTQSTNGDGVTRFDGVESGAHWVVASAAGMAPARQLVQIASGAEGAVVRARLILERGVPVTGTVVDAGGKPVADARVAAIPASKVFAGIDVRRDGTTSDGRGKFELSAVAPGTYRFIAAKSGYPLAQSEPTPVGDAAVGGVEIRFGEPATLAGRVEDASGQPVPWAIVRVQGTSGGGGFDSSSRQAVADEQGAFEMTGLDKTTLTVVARSDQAASDLIQVDLRKGDRKDLVVRLTIDGVIAGVVTDSAGEPVDGAQVVAMPDFWSGADTDGFGLRGPASVRTDPGGNFLLAGLPPGTYRVRAAHSSSWQSLWASQGVQAKVGDKDVHLTLDVEGGIEGELVTDQGDHPELFTVTARFPPGVPVVSDDGSFHVSDLAPGTYDVSFQGPDFAEKIVADVVVEPGVVTRMGTITVTRGRTLSGRVVDSSGSPVDGATVVAGVQIVGDGRTILSPFGAGSDQMQKVRRTTTDEDGAFRLIGLAPGPLVLAAEKAGAGRSLGQDVQPGVTGSLGDVALRGYGGVHGVVTVGGQPSSGMQVLATSTEGSGNQINVVTTGKDGSYAFDALPAGDYKLLALAGGIGGAGQSGSATATVRVGGRARVDIAIDLGDIDVTVAIQGKDDAVIDAAQVFLIRGEVHPATGKEVNDVVSQGDGGFRMAFAMGGKSASFSKVSPGEYSVCTIPINGNMMDPSFQKRLQDHRMELAVYCDPVTVAEAPKSQSFTVSVPAMTPLPAPGDEG